MVIVKIKQLKIRNFKGIEKLDINFNDSVTDIFGANATGKSTILDGFNFLLFNKNAEGDEKFSKKPLTAEGKTNKNINNIVDGVFDINGKEVTLEHTHSEDWVSSGGEQQFRGNTNSYKYNGVPTKPREYEKMINDIISEETFKMVTNPLYFPSLTPEIRRRYIEKICGTMTDNEIAETHKKYNELINDINLITIQQLKTKLKAEKANIQKEIKRIPIRIEEAMRNLPEEFDVAALHAEIEHKQAEYNNLDRQLNSISEQERLINEKQLAKVKRINKLNLDNQNILSKHRLDYNQELQKASENENLLNSQLTTVKNQLSNKERELGLAEETPGKINLLKNEIYSANEKLESLRTSYDQKSEMKFELDENAFACTYCGELPSDPEKIKEKRSKKREDFYENLNIELDSISKKGQELNNLIEKNTSQINELVAIHQKYVSELKLEVNQLIDKKVNIESELLELPDSNEIVVKSVETRISEDLEHKANLDEISGLQSEIEPEAEKSFDFKEIQKQKALISADLDSMKRKSYDVEKRKQMLDRRDEINNEQASLGAASAEIDRKLNLIGNFEQDKARMIEDRVSEHFQIVRFKFFDFTLDGEVVPTCEILLNGVPFKDLNSAGKINAGLDVIKTLSNHFGVKAPIFIDNRESITEILDMETQVINLIVSPMDKKLRIEN